MYHIEISAKELNSSNIKYYKILPQNLNTYGMQYHVGTNRMHNPEMLGVTVSSEEGVYEPGLYFATKNFILCYCHYGEMIATVKVPDDAKVIYWPGEGDFASDALIITQIRPLWDITTLKELEKEGVTFYEEDMLECMENIKDSEEIKNWLNERLKRNFITGGDTDVTDRRK